MDAAKNNLQMTLEQSKKDLVFCLDWRDGARREFREIFLKQPDTPLRIKRLNDLIWVIRRCQRLKKRISEIEAEIRLLEERF